MSSLYLVRHCEYDNPRNILPGRLPVELSEKGKKQARKLTEYFKDKSIAKIHSSAVLRCKQTSEIISSNAIPIVYDKRLLEIHSAYQGIAREPNDPLKEYEYFYGHIPELGGESLYDIYTRMASFFEELLLDLHENVIVCSHGDPLYMAYYWFTKKPLPSINEVSDPNLSDYQEKASVREVVVEQSGHTLRPILQF
ncbi:MAG TPA: hypothetical protein DCX25_01145 [Candidatus Pacebacteria bacterium]|nr:MAG: Phosphoglycerate mutase [Microgenomates group bacterium GW2011_GWB1_45_17]KKU23579.1 MAG: Phosphoglycerate mutase [Microgenomates group bacterium GW2011_GWC1_46_15]KKU24298.1 MAG: Phosphoglycerate mutase [Microgenomates group bacterium GW2011_GWA1_46_15]HAV14915.1 hypothetical protein [Candidatus Paceibacterota bacterium]HCR11334.1 hypothetical protein [Candidatus Paceibacterota bacterium]